MAIPRGLVSRDMVRQMEGVKSIRTNVLPANSSGHFEYTGNNRVIFQIPAFPNSFINTKRSYIKFKLETSGKLVSGANVFRRMLLKNSRGQVLEDTDNYDILSQVMDQFKTKEQLAGQAYTHKKYDGLDPAPHDIISVNTGLAGVTVVHELNSGILGNHQDFMIPVSSMVASSGYAFQLELFLNENGKVCDNYQYKLSDVSYEVELVEVTDSIMSDLNSELSSGSEIPLPYRSWRSHTTSLNSSLSQKVNISESAINLESVMSVIVPSSFTQSPFTNGKVAQAVSPYVFGGGKTKLLNNGTGISDNAAAVTKYSFRYGSTYYPTAPVELIGDSVLALENALSVFDMQEKVPNMTGYLLTGESSSGANDHKLVPRFECTDFMIGHNFRTTTDPIKGGLNASSSGAPLELNLTFKGDPSAVSSEIVTFVQQLNTLYIKKEGASSVISG